MAHRREQVAGFGERRFGAQSPSATRQRPWARRAQAARARCRTFASGQPLPCTSTRPRLIAGRLGELGPDRGELVFAGRRRVGRRRRAARRAVARRVPARRARETARPSPRPRWRWWRRARRALAAAPALARGCLGRQELRDGGEGERDERRQTNAANGNDKRVGHGGFFQGTAFREQPQQRAWFDVAHVTAGLDPVRNRARLGERLLGVAEIGQSGRDRGASLQHHLGDPTAFAEGDYLAEDVDRCPRVLG